MFSSEMLRTKALLALEEAVVETRNGPARRSLALRFALAYLYASAPRDGQALDRRPFDELWKALGAAKTPWSFTMADSALSGLYRAIGVKRDDEVSDMLWRRMEAERKQARAGEER
jgi:hypothetical protein